MNKIKKNYIMIIIGVVILIAIFLMSKQQKSTDYIDVVEEILEKQVEGIALSLEDVVSLQEKTTISLDVDTATINGKLVDLEKEEYLIGLGIQLFKELSHLEEIRIENKFKDTGYYLLSLNVDFKDGTNYDEPHKLALLIDKESHNILIPKDYDIENPYNISFTNYLYFSPNEASEEYINDIVNEVNVFKLPAKEATYTFDQNYGVSMVNQEGQAVWDEFLDKTEKGQPSMVRLGFYYTLRDPSKYSKEHYEEIKDDYPVLYLMDLTYDNEKYLLKFYDKGKLISREYLYMMKYEGQPNSEATYSDYIYYVLVNDNSVTWEEIQKGMYSSQMGDAIEHYKVYSDIVYK